MRKTLLALSKNLLNKVLIILIIVVLGFKTRKTFGDAIPNFQIL